MESSVNWLVHDAISSAKNEYERLIEKINNMEKGLFDYRSLQTNDLNEKMQDDIDELKEEKAKVGMYLFKLGELKREFC